MKSLPGGADRLLRGPPAQDLYHTMLVQGIGWAALKVLGWLNLILRACWFMAAFLAGSADTVDFGWFVIVFFLSYCVRRLRLHRYGRNQYADSITPSEEALWERMLENLQMSATGAPL